MTVRPKFSIGIDLGTTNCALSYVALDEADSSSQILPIVQRDELNTLVEATTLPSFLYLPSDTDRIQESERVDGACGRWIVGEHARKRTMDSPGRVVHSAKSWLAHHAIDPEASVLPWRSTEVPDSDKLSPLAASAHLLRYLKICWDKSIGAQNEDSKFEYQSIVITVPASFDAASQKATLDAARKAGYPETVRLLEEPQAAFYRWLETREEATAVTNGQRILVVDIGGGTSDFSLFRVNPSKSDESPPDIEREAVSDHILLGGDNIDLALAYALESELTESEDELNLDQWGHLLARSRHLKEQCLASDSASETPLSVSIPSKGSGLIAGTLSTQVSGSDVRELLLEGFFPFCPRTAKPDTPSGALQEWGLPYATDCAVTRYLADFLRNKPKIDAVLFNGGTLAAPLIRQRLIEQFTNWQSGTAPRNLQNAETDLAVARGAAAYGAAIARQASRIVSGAARTLYIEVASSRSSDEKRLVTILPRGANANELHRSELEGLQLAVNQVVRFQVYRGAHQCEDAAGSIVELDTTLHTRLPALETKIAIEGNASTKTIPVSLQSKINELGLLEIVCLSTDPQHEGEWALEFNLREESSAVPNAKTDKPSISKSSLERAARTMKSGLGRSDAKASRIIKELESAIGLPKGKWDLILSRELGDIALQCKLALHKSDAQAENWFQIAGYLLRPGFGHSNDPERLKSIFNEKIDKLPLSNRVEVQAHIFWRRLAGGLNKQQQSEIFEREFAALDSPKKATAERIRLLGALEHVDLARKLICVKRFLDDGLAASKDGGYPAPYFSALGQLLSRTLFHAGPEMVLAPEQVSLAFERLSKLDWKDPKNSELIPLFLKAARLVDDRGLDLPNSTRKKIAKNIEKSGVPAARCAPLLGYIPLSLADKASIYGESLPDGLVLSQF